MEGGKDLFFFLPGQIAVYPEVYTAQVQYRSNRINLSNMTNMTLFLVLCTKKPWTTIMVARARVALVVLHSWTQRESLEVTAEYDSWVVCRQESG